METRHQNLQSTKPYPRLLHLAKDCADASDSARRQAILPAAQILTYSFLRSVPYPSFTHASFSSNKDTKQQPNEALCRCRRRRPCCLSASPSRSLDPPGIPTITNFRTALSRTKEPRRHLHFFRHRSASLVPLLHITITRNDMCIYIYICISLCHGRQTLYKVWSYAAQVSLFNFPYRFTQSGLPFLGPINPAA